MGSPPRHPLPPPPRALAAHGNAGEVVGGVAVWGTPARRAVNAMSFFIFSFSIFSYLF